MIEVFNSRMLSIPEDQQMSTLQIYIQNQVCDKLHSFGYFTYGVTDNKIFSIRIYNSYEDFKSNSPIYNYLRSWSDIYNIYDAYAADSDCLSKEQAEDKAANAIATNCYLKIYETTKPDD